MIVSILSPPLLTCLYQFVHVERRANLENAAVLHGRMLGHELYSMIHVPRREDENAAELFLGFRIGTVGRCNFAVLPIQSQGGFRLLKRLSTSPMPVGAKMVVVFKACVEHGVSLGLGHAFVFAFVVVSQTDVFHCSSPSGRSRQHSLAFIVKSWPRCQGRPVGCKSGDLRHGYQRSQQDAAPQYAGRALCTVRLSDLPFRLTTAGRQSRTLSGAPGYRS